MFSSILKSFQKEEQRSGNQNSDLEEDGFLVVGQSRNEQTTIKTIEFDQKIDRPPSYMEVTEEKDLAMFNTRTTNVPNDSAQYSNAVMDNIGHPLQDVPFSINPQLQLMWGVGQTGLPITRLYDPSKYEYDFTLEYSIVNSS